MAAVALSFLSSPYKIYHGNEKSTLVCKLWTFSITNQLERHSPMNECLRVEKTMESSLFKGTPVLKKSNSIIVLGTSAFHLDSPGGFGPPPKKNKKTKKSKSGDDKEEEDEEEELETEAGIIPEVVTNRMISRMGFSVGILLFRGLLFFPFFYFLKAVLKIDVPTWVPFIVSFFFFGTALLGVSYGIVSSSWDPMRDGSLLGWNEAQKNWPVFWQSIGDILLLPS